MRQYTEVAAKGNNQDWKPQANEKNGMAFTPDSPNNILEGYFSSEREASNRDGKPFTVVTITTISPNGEVGESFDVIADTVLCDRLKAVSLNSFVCLKYLGRNHKKGYSATSPWSQTNSYHNWWVGVDANAIPFNQLIGRPAAANQPVNAAPVQQQTAPFNPQQVFNGQMPAQPVFNGQQVPQQQTFAGTAQVLPAPQQQYVPPAQAYVPPAQQKQAAPVANPNVFGGIQNQGNDTDLPF